MVNWAIGSFAPRVVRTSARSTARATFGRTPRSSVRFWGRLIMVKTGKMRNPMIWVVLIGHKSWVCITLARIELLLKKLVQTQNKM